MGVEPVLAVESEVTVGPVAPVAPPRVELGVQTGLADWRGDVALELWVETDALPPRIRLAGRLDASTAANLTQVVGELLADGSSEIELCTEGLRAVDSSAIGALADIERQVRAEGGSLVRVGPSGGPFGRARRGSASPVARA
jgi:anti-anti-sigma factor